MTSAGRASGEDDEAGDASRNGRGLTVEKLWRVGRTSWALIGLAGVAVLLGYVFSRTTLVAIPLILALFPASLLVPVVKWLERRGVPAALSAVISIVGGIVVIAAVIGAMIPLVLMEFPDLAASATEGVAEIERFLTEDLPFDVGFDGFNELLQQLQQNLPEFGDVAGQAVSAATAAFEFLAGLVLMLVALFFYLKDGRRIINGIVATAPARARPRLEGATERAWDTIGSYFRGQLTVALVDAVFIGLGLALLRVPLALPLAVLIFFGALFPIVGAVVTGSLAVLVALADQGLLAAVIVLGLVLLVQQIEGNVLQPFILGHAISLHPLLVLLVITVGGVTLGILGAFLAVPFSAIVARILDYLREDRSDGADRPIDEQPAEPPPSSDD